jgi:hypothetical protein
VAEDPLRQLGRVAAGIVLMQGKLGHQVLGQLLILDSSEVAIAGAALAVAAATGPRNQIVQVALRTVVPTIAAHLVLNKQEERIERKEKILDEREKNLEDREHLTEQVKRLSTLVAEGRIR